MIEATALWVTGPGTVVLRRSRLDEPGRDQVRVRTLFSGISRGTELVVLAGGVPDSEHERMRAPFQKGAFPSPVKYGYANVGVVEIGPLAGRTVFCLYPHQDRYVVPAAAVLPVPDGVPPERAVLAANMETALNVVWDAGIAPGDRVAVVGCGVVGALTAFLAAGIPGTEVTAVDINPDRQEVASALGAGFASPEDAPEDCDVVVHTSATGAGLDTAIACAGFEAKVIEASWFGSGTVPVALGGPFHSGRLTLVSSQVGHLPAHRRARWTHRRRLQTALALLTDARLDRLISGETSFSDSERDYAARLADPATLCHRFRYP